MKKLPSFRAHYTLACLLFTLGCRAERSSDELLKDYPCLARLTTELGHTPCVPEPQAEGTTDCRGELPGVIPLRRWQCSPRPSPRSEEWKTLVKAGSVAFSRAARENATEQELLQAATFLIFLQKDERTMEQAGVWLRRGLVSASKRQRFLASLGAVYLVLAARSGKTEALLHSIEYSEQALEEQPDAAGPRYNLALALSQLGLSISAREEWHRFLAREPEGPWATEARSWLASLPPEDGEPLKRTPSSDRQLTREWIERELLTRWAKARLDGSEEAARRDLARAAQLASDLAMETGDRLLGEAVTVISGASAAEQRRMAQAHQEFVEGYRLLYDRSNKNPTGARKRFLQAEQKLGRSPFVLWARFYQALTLQGLQEFARAEAELAILAAEVDPNRYPALMGRIHWVRGLATSALGRVEESNAHYRSAAAIFCRLGEHQNLAATQGLLAAGMSKIGHHEAAWTLTRSALTRRRSIFQLLRLQAILQDAVNNAQRQGDLRRAGYRLANEWIAVAEREGSPDTLHNAFMRRAALHEVLGRPADARVDRDRAVLASELIESPELRLRANADFAVVVPSLLSEKPDEAVMLLTRFIGFYRKSGNQQMLPRAYALRAQGYLAQQQIELAERDLREEARLLETTLFTTSPGPLRQDLAATLKESFDRMIGFQATVRRDAAAAFHSAEQARHWGLWEWARNAADRKSGAPMLLNPRATASWADLEAVRGEGTAILAFHVLPDRVLLWASGPRGRVMETVAIDRRSLRSKVSALLVSAETGRTAAMRDTAGELYEILMTPVAASISGVPRLIIVPDRTLQELPFGLLHDPSTGSYLYENHALVYSPSATASTRLARRRHDPPTKIRHLLAVAATQGDHPERRRLPEAAAEAKSVAAQWPGGEVLQNVADLRRKLALADAFHFAGHALADSNSLYLLVSDDGERSLKMTATDILGDDSLRLHLVTLSGCRTADLGIANQTGSSSAGFVRSFLAAGTYTVVASFLDLSDRKAREVFTAFYRWLAKGEDPARALHQACLEQPSESRDEGALLCGSLAVFGSSSPFAR